jgi:uncharacterized protein YqiB (DUF1249 family)
MTYSVDINSYVTDVIGEDPIVVSDEIIIAGMEDVIRRVETMMPELISEFNTETTVASVPVTLHAPSLGITVYKDNNVVVQRNSRQHLSNELSLLNDRGETAYYYIIGNKLYIEPYKPSMFTYSVIGVAYGVQYGTVTFPRRLKYPLALYCAQSETYNRYRSAIQAVTSDISTLPSISILPADLALVQARITADDAEMAAAQIAKLRLQIDAVSAQAGIDSIRIQRIQSRIEYANSMLNKHMVTRATYDAFFTAGQQPMEQR